MNVQPFPKEMSLVPRDILNILRIVQVAHTNILKHVRTTTIKVATGVDEILPTVSVSVSDNGRGFVEDKNGY